MLQIQIDKSLSAGSVPFGVLDVLYPEPEERDLPGFRATVNSELETVRREYADYDRKAVFGDNPYFRHFRKYKKSYPIMMQLESFLLKGRPFPDANPVNEVAFLAELRTGILLGAHDVDRMEGALTLFSPSEKILFTGIGGRDVHLYPGDISGRDEGGIILSMIAGADDRTYVTKDSRHVAYFVFGTEGMDEREMGPAFEALTAYARALAPGATFEKSILRL